ncbi:MAG TPA: hypothetical protein VMT51_14380 [Dongiaceae bacterium]|nr:hypothetical protein [Dongiaceae bacterium]
MAEFAEEFVQNDSGGGGDVERGFLPEHRDADVGAGHFEKLGIQALHLIAKQNADREYRLPVVEVGGVEAGFYSGEFIAFAAEAFSDADGVGVVFPGNDGFGSKRGFADGVFWRVSRDAAKVELLQGNAVGDAEEGTDVVHAADVVNEDARRQAGRMGHGERE